MLNLVSILLIAICFVLHCFFFIDFFPQFHTSIYLFGSKFCFFVFLNLSLTGSPWSHDLGYGSKRLAWVWLLSFKKKTIYQYFFFALLFSGSSQFHVVGHVFDLFTRVGCRVHLRLFFLSFFICFHHTSKCLFFKFFCCVRPFVIFFYGTSLFNHFLLYLSFKS